MRIAVIVDNYLTANDLYANGFIHQRIKEYNKRFECTVLSSNTDIDYIYEGVEIKSAKDLQAIRNILNAEQFDKIIVHFVKWWLIDYLIYENRLPTLIWVHGYETLSWLRYHFSFKPASFLRPSFYIDFIFYNLKQRYYVRKLIRQSNKSSQISFIFVSDWMKRACEWDTFTKVKYFHIIPNPIDTEKFTRSEKGPELASKILLIRSFNSRKYANDIAINAIQILSTHDLFQNLEISIFGKGKDFSKLTSKLKEFKNINITNSFLNPDEIKDQHEKHGIFLCPTRMDAQGVSMCEAMASSLVVITSNNTAIPEFIDHNVNGILTSSPRQIAEQIINLNNNPERFCSLSQAATEKVVGSIDHKTVINKELGLIMSQLT